jgi:hypothetical protein
MRALNSAIAPLLPSGDDLPKLARLDQAGLTDVAEADPSFLDVLTDVLDRDHWAMIVLFHVQDADLRPAEFDESLRDLRDGIERTRQDPC